MLKSWDEITHAVSADYPDLIVNHMHIGAMCAKFVTQPEALDVVPEQPNLSLFQSS